MAEDPKDVEKTLGKLSAPLPSVEPVHLTEDENTGDRFLIYSTSTGIKVRLRFDGDGLWMTQAQISELFGRDVSVISRHIANVLDEGELSEASNLQKVQIASSTRPVILYSLDMVISVGYRVSSGQATLFRKWATGVLVQFATKGFTVDIERLKEPTERDHFRELREIIREIRASEANVYRELRDIILLCSDYASLDESRKNAFFATVQNKLLYAVTGMTAAELRVDRALASKENMGLTTWQKRSPRKADVMTAKNFLGAAEVRDLNRFTNMILDYFEQEAEMRRLVLTSDAEKALDRFIRNNDRQLLKGLGSVSKKDADAHCEAEYDKFNDMRKKHYLQSDEDE
jgi:hypothetical protein